MKRMHFSFLLMKSTVNTMWLSAGHIKTKERTGPKIKIKWRHEMVLKKSAIHVMRKVRQRGKGTLMV